jgi:predicted XRE-type DNA-binding protein
VLAGLRLKNADGRQTRMRLMMALNAVLDARELSSQREEAKCLGVGRPKVSLLRNYYAGAFSLERLIRLLTTMDCDVEIVIRSRSGRRKPGRVTVVAA